MIKRLKIWILDGIIKICIWGVNRDVRTGDHEAEAVGREVLADMRKERAKYD